MKRIHRIGCLACLLSASVAFAQTQTPVQASAPQAGVSAQASNDNKDSKVQALIDKMQDAIGDAKESKDSSGIKAVITEACKAEISDADLGSIVAMAVKAVPSEVASFVQSAVIASGGSNASSARVLTVMSAAVSAHPHPFSAVLAVRDSVLQVVGDSPALANQVKNEAIAIADYAPDNPLSVVAVESAAGTTPVSERGSSVTSDAGGSRILPVDSVPFVPLPLPPASPFDGAK